MPDFKNKKLRLYGGSGLLVVAFAGMSLVSYRLGYRDGSGDISTPPASAALLNIHSSNDLSTLLNDSASKVDFGDFWRTWNILDKNFTPSSSTTAATSTEEWKVAGAIDGLVRSYNDPYTVFIPKEKADTFKEQVNGEFDGIGAGVGSANGATVVIGVLPNSPAQKAGLAAGDEILAVDSLPTSGVDINTITSHIRGPKGTVVSLTIVRGKSTKEMVVPITRDTVILPTTATKVVSAAKSVIAAIVAKASAAAAALTGGHGVAAADALKAADAAKQKFFVLQLVTFSKSSTDGFITDLGRFAKSNTPYLIIDLRNNPGGYLEVANDLASYFLPKGALVVTEKTGATNATTEYRSLGYPLLSHLATSSRRIVVLINRNSASASEILAGALQDQGAAKIVGETSFGKGSAQQLVDIGNIGSLKITVARWYTPSGKNISHLGITPDIAVDIKDPKFASSTDPFMDAAVETILDDSLWPIKH